MGTERAGCRSRPSRRTDSSRALLRMQPPTSRTGTVRETAMTQVRASRTGSEPRIYVQMPAYRDSELEKTLRDLYSKADHPKRLRTAVLWQRAPDESLSADVRLLPGLEILDVDFTASRGPNWARAQLQKGWREEPLTLLLDSHHRFVRGWDSAVVSMYGQLRSSGVEKPLLTAYLPSYDPAREPGARKKRPYKIYPLQREQGVLTRLTSYPIPYWTRLNEPVAADFVSLHFLFAEGCFNETVAFDPEIYFFGDEVVTGLRAYLAGYDLYHPHRIIGWHCFDRASRVGHWDDHSEWAWQHENSVLKMRRLFLDTDGQGRANGERTVSDYEEQIMVPLVMPT
jgi:hypothetical protein